MSLFALGSVDPLLVERFSGFDLPGFAAVVRLLSDGSEGPHEVLQSSGIPRRQAAVTGTLHSEAAVEALRGYDLSKEEVLLRDGRGGVTLVRVLELTTEDHTDWWDFAATLLATSATEAETS